MAVKIGNLRVNPSRRGWTIVALCALAFSSYTADAVASIGRVRSGVKAGSLELGGRTGDESRRVLGGRAQQLKSDPVEVFADRHRFSVAPSEISFSPRVDATLDEAMAVGRRGNIIVRTWHRFRSLFARTDVGWKSSYDRAAAGLLVRDWAARIDTDGHEAGIDARGVTLVPVGAVPGRLLNQRGAVQTMITALEDWPRHSMELPISVRARRTNIDDARQAAAVANRWVQGPIMLTAPDGSRHYLSREELAGMLEAVPRRSGGEWKLRVRFAPDRVTDALAAEMKPYELQPRDASFAVQGVSVSVIAGQAGRRFDAEGTAKALAAVAGRAAGRSARAVFSSVEPDLSTEEARGLRIKELVSTFTTHHPCCAPRVTNIHKISDVVNGTIVRPGGTFSLNGRAGPRTTEKGYVLAPMIFDGEYRDDIGGGVSQFATTMYNAIFFGGYRIGTHKPHSYYISRYPAGREATVSWPHPDLTFSNNSSSGILIRTSYSSTSVTVSFYGDKEGRSVTAQSGERTNFTNFEEQRKENPDLPPGQERVVQHGAKGFDIVVFRIINRNGQVERQRFFTRYKPEPRIIEFGPEPSPSPSPSPNEGDRKPRQTPKPAPSPTPAPGGAPGSGV